MNKISYAKCNTMLMFNKKVTKASARSMLRTHNIIRLSSIRFESNIVNMFLLPLICTVSSTVVEKLE